jgi:predicted dinucleotide-binding enzyme
VFGVRDPNGARAIAAVGDSPRSSAVTAPEASERCDVVVLAVPLDALDDVLGQIGSLAGKTVIDAVNAVRHPPPGGFPSVSQFVADRLPDAMVAKAFNTVGFEVMLEPVYPTGRAVMPIAGHDGARPIAGELARSIGFDVLDLGGIDSAPLVEAWASVWIRSMMAGRGRTFAFGVLER